MSFSQLYIHMVWSTKYRQPQLTPGFRDRVFAFMGGIAKDAGAIPILINGVSDHVHCLVVLPRTLTVAQLAKEMKCRSSGWANQEARGPVLDWQEEYAAFSVSPFSMPTVKKYIARQEEHHRSQSFQEEFVQALQDAGIEYQERYLFTHEGGKTVGASAILVNNPKK